jgi:tRNA nucleotidyltransferase/poly(A) polymerase
MAKSSPARLLEEYYKILRSGYAEKTFRALASTGLLEPVSAELHQGADEPLWQSLAALDAYRRRFQTSPDTFTNAVLLGSLLVPLGFTAYPSRHAERRLRDRTAHVRVRRTLTHRHVFPDSLTWLEIHGQLPDLVAEWHAIVAERGTELPPPEALEGEPPPVRRRRRRRRRRYRPAPNH